MEDEMESVVVWWLIGIWVPKFLGPVLGDPIRRKNLHWGV